MAFGSSALQSLNTFSNLKFESERAMPLLYIECMMGVLVGWHLMTWSDPSASYSLAAKIMSSYS
jgi:hypothetical protein